MLTDTHKCSGLPVHESEIQKSSYIMDRKLRIELKQSGNLVSVTLVAFPDNCKTSLYRTSHKN